MSTTQELLAANERYDALERGVIVWLVEVLHYPFDLSFDTPPPVDHGKLADYWNESDGWKVTAEEARAAVFGEAGVDLCATCTESLPCLTCGAGL